MEYENPTRRYKWFRPRQAQYGSIQPGTHVNYGQGSLYNDSTGPQLLVVRAINMLSSQGANMFLQAYQGKSGAPGGTVSPFVAGEARLAGALFSLDNASGLFAVFGMSSPTGSFPFNGSLPVMVLPPGWSLLAQSSGLADVCTFSFLWEAISIDELDFLY